MNTAQELDRRSSCAVVVPIYKPLSESERNVLAHNINMLEAYNFVIVAPQSLSDYLSSLTLVGGEQITVQCFNDVFFSDVQAYSRLMLQTRFYAVFARYDYVLICQLDCLILRDELSAWIEKGFSYVGAPIFIGFTNPKKPYEFDGALNGGLSLRKLADVDRVLKQAIFLRISGVRVLEKTGLLRLANLLLAPFHKILVPLRPRLNEDMVWSKIVPNLWPCFSLPHPQEAANFAFEVAPRYLFTLTEGRLPFGCHAFEKYDSSFWREHIAEFEKFLETPPQK